MIIIINSSWSFIIIKQDGIHEAQHFLHVTYDEFEERGVSLIHPINYFQIVFVLQTISISIINQQ